MPDPTVAAIIVLLIALVEATPAIRIPTGLLLATALLAAGAELLPIAAIGAVGVMLARLSLAIGARRRRDQLDPGSAAPGSSARANRDALRDRLARSPAYARTTFLLAAAPGIPAGFVFPLLGATRMPLWPALAGTVVGRVPVLAITTALFAWLGRALTGGDDPEAALLLGGFAVVLLVLNTISRIDWQHRSEHGRWRMREDPDPLTRIGVRFVDPDAGSEHRWSTSVDPAEIEGDVVEGELIDEEIEDHD